MLGLGLITGLLNGSSNDPLALKAQLVEIKRQRAAIPGKKAELKNRRLEALRSDDDVQARKIEKELADVDRDADRLADREFNVSEQARAAQAAADKRAEDEAEAGYDELTLVLIANVESTEKAAMAQCQYWKLNERVLVRSGVSPVGCVLVMGQGHGLPWAQDQRRKIAARRQRVLPSVPAPAQAVARAPPHKPRMTDSQRQVSLALGDGAGQRRPFARRRDDDAPLAPGQARLVAIRPGVEVTGRQYGAGDTFRTDIPTAQRLLRAGAVEMIEESLDQASSAATAGTDTSVGSEEVRA